MMRNSARVLALFLAVFPAATLALGLGNVEVSTTLNEPLRAEIPLTGLKPGEIEDVDIRLGTEEQFRRAGLERPFHLSRITFTVVPDEGEGGPHVALTTREPVTEPFLNFLVELNWPNGRLIREYTLLLDPPVYGAAITSTAEREVAVVNTLPESSESSEPVPLPAPQPEMIAVPEPAAPEPAAPAVTPPQAQAPEAYPPAAPPPAPTASAPAPEPEPVPAPAPEPQAEPTTTLAAAPPPELAGVDRYGPVVANESLWSIAERVRPDESISIQRMMLAILEANPDAFILDNINSLKRGEVLRIPGREQIGADEKALAMAEVRRHQAIWDDYRQQIAAAPGPAAEGTAATAQPSAEPAAEPSVPPAAEVEDTSRLELVGTGVSEAAGAAPGDQASAAELRQQLNLALEEADSKLRENRELSERLQETEQILGDLNRMLEFKDDEIARLQQQLAELQAVPSPEPQATPEPETVTAPEPEPQVAPEPEPQVAPEPETAAAPEPEPQPDIQAQAQPAPETQAAAQPQPSPPPPAPQRISFVDDLLNTARGYVPSGLDPIMAAGALGLVLLLSGGLALHRRRQAAGAGAEPEAINFEDDPDAMAAALAEDADEDRIDRPADEAADVATDDQTLVAGSEAGAADTLESGDEDPLSELNIYMAYEHFDQAEDLVRRAIADHPDNHEYRLKLLEVFYAAKDLPSFQEAARELRDAVGPDSAHIATAAGWWADLAPGRELFAGPAEGAGTATSTGEEVAEDELFDVTQAEGEDIGEESAVDFDLGFESAGEDATKEDSLGSSVDFDLDSGEQEVSKDESSSDVDFDLGGLDEDADEGSADLAALAEEPEAPAVDVDNDDLDFDSGDTEAERTAAASALSGSGIDFDLDSEDNAGASSEADALASSGLDFEFDSVTSDDGLSETAADLGLNLEKFEDSGTGTGDKDDADSGEEELAIDFETGSGDGEESAQSSSLDLSLEDSGDDLSGASPDTGGDVDFDLGGDEGESKGTGIDTVFKGVFGDDSPGERAGGDDDSGDDPLGIGDGSDELPELESGTEDAVDLTFLGDAGGTADDELSDLDFGPDDDASEDTGEQKTQYMLRDGNGADADAHADAGNGSAELDDVQTKLDLAEAYIEMGDTDGARGILGEVMSEGSDVQQEQAKDLLSKLG